MSAEGGGGGGGGGGGASRRAIEMLWLFKIRLCLRYAFRGWRCVYENVELFLLICRV